jgi:N-acyl-D-amino-acid deacylase
MPAQREHLSERGLIQTGYFADITVFDPATIIDEATYAEPTKLSQGVDYVLVNGQLEYDHGAATGAKAGRALKGPGYRAASQ